MSPSPHHPSPHHQGPPQRSQHRRWRLPVVLVSAAGLVLGLPNAALAHITVQPSEAEVGSYEKLTFRVPNESDDAGTVEVRVTFPEDTPFGSARVKPRSGWTADVEKQTLPEPIDVGHGEVDEAVRSITWTAEDGTSIGPDEFDEFEVSVGRLPDVDRLAFPAVQVYDDGEEVAWDEVVEPGAGEPEQPAPMLTLTGNPSNGPEHGDDASENSDQQSDQADEQATATDDTARAVGAAGLVVGILGLAAGVLAWMASRRRGPGVGK